ncbi:hypothetical protein N7528_003679 [Penicillium herquei]|nr:hypothetical protein N7528_003679 [Penicillium herquei]
MASMITNIHIFDAHSRLTDQELIGLTWALYFKEIEGDWDKNQILPALVFTYMVPNHGRILQVMKVQQQENYFFGTT